MNKQTDNQQIDPVADAQATLVGFEKQKAALVDKQTKLADKRRASAFDAANGDVAAGKLINGLAHEAAELQMHLDSIDDAIKEGERRLHQARQAEADTIDRERATALLAHLKQFRDLAAATDNALTVLVEVTNGMAAALRAIHAAGSPFPTDAQLLSLGGRVMLAAMSKTPFKRNFETLPPLERERTMSSVAAQWAQTVENGVVQKLGQPNKPNEAA
jgi:hypothetical protein